MSLSEQERRLLAGIEVDLCRQYPRLARRFAEFGRPRRTPYAVATSRRELICVFLVVLVMATLPVIAVLLAGGA